MVEGTLFAELEKKGETSVKPKMRILVVDDEPEIREVLSQFLSTDGNEVKLAASGEEALEAFRKEPFPLVISDVIMKKMSGIDLLQEVKRLEPDTEVILITHYADIDTAIAALRHGAFDYLMKTYDTIESISTVVERAFDKIRRREEERMLLEGLHRHNVELERNRNSLKDSAVRDELTGLYNHHYLHEALAVELNRAAHSKQSFSLIIFDVEYCPLDGAPKVNADKTHLHIVAAEIAKKRLRKTDLIVRYHEEKFIALFPETPRDGAHCVAENIRKLVASRPVRDFGMRSAGEIVVCLGTAVYPEDGTDSTTLILHADKEYHQEKILMGIK
jgi:diguanylate cyclase (GGDEF)-like protein